MIVVWTDIRMSDVVGWTAEYTYPLLLCLAFQMSSLHWCMTWNGVTLI